MLYFSFNYFSYNDNIMRQLTLTNYRAFADADNWKPAEFVKYFGGLLLFGTAFIFHLLGFFG